MAHYQTVDHWEIGRVLRPNSDRAIAPEMMYAYSVGSSIRRRLARALADA